MGLFIMPKFQQQRWVDAVVIDYFDYILGKLEESKTKRERFVTTDLNLVKSVRELEKKGLVQYRMKMQPAQPFGLICHDDWLNTLSDWAEKMICQLIGAKQTSWNEEGHDGVLRDGTRVEIKHAVLDSQGKIQIGKFKEDGHFDLIVAAIWYEKPNRYSLKDATFMIITKEDAFKYAMNNCGKIDYQAFKNKHKKALSKFEHSFGEFINLKHGYAYLLKMKGKTLPVEMPKESIQFVIDIWEPNEYGLMPFDERYEDSSWYAEFMVAHFLSGKVTEQRCAGYDVKTDNGDKIQVKLGNLSIRNGCGTAAVTLNALKTKSDYDYLVGFSWDNIEDAKTYNPWLAKVIIIPKQIVELIKIPYKKGDLSNGRIEYTLNFEGKYRKNAKIHKVKPFMFTIDRLAELGQIGWEAFYNKYLKEACEEALQKYGKGDH